MKKIVMFMIAVLFSGSIFSQNQWEYKDYKTIDYKNFRQDKRINQICDMDNPDIPLLNALLVFLTNEKRAGNDLTQLKYHHACEIAAYNHSYKMAEDDFFSHLNPKDKTRNSTNNRAELAGIKNPYIAENVAYIFTYNGDSYLHIAEELINNWMESPGHKANILSEKALQMGCGVYFKDNKVYATQVYQWFSEIQPKSATDKLPKLKDGSQPEIEDEDSGL